MKKRLFLIGIIALTAQLVTGQQAKKTSGPSMRVWTITDKTADIVPADLDTAVVAFPNQNAVNDYSIANAYNGTLVSPLQSKIYDDRTEKTDFFFSRPFDAYFSAPTDILFFNTKRPFANLIYNNTGGKLNKEDRFYALFSINANKKLNFAAMVDYIAARGAYEFQATSQSKAGFWSSYKGRRYEYNGIFMYQRFKAQENGGITDDGYLTNDSLNDIDEVQIPVRLNDAQSQYRNIYFYYNHKYNIFDRKIEIDSVTVEYLPILSLAHNFKVESAEKRYMQASPSSDFYANTYLNPAATMDSTSFLLLRNNVALSINEGFSKWFPLGITAYVEHSYIEHYNINDSINQYVKEKSHLLIGAEIAKRMGKKFLFDVNGELNLAGRRIGDFKLDGGMSSAFRLWRDTMSIAARAFIKSTSPQYFEEHYISNHFIWDNNFDRTLRTRVEGSLGLHNKWLNGTLGVGVENITKMIYFDENALPAQYNGNIQVLSAKANLDFTLGIWHLDNKLVYQHSSNQGALPLPALSLYSNFYAYFKMFKKVLGTHLGVDLYYHTAYNAPLYMPATGVFYSQNHTKVGNYPLMSFYVNLHLKTVRFYFKYYNFSSWFMPKNYFSMPNYPLYPARTQIGVSWNFYD